MTRYEIGAIVLVGSVIAHAAFTAFNMYGSAKANRIAEENNRKLEEFADEVNKIAKEERPITKSDAERLRNIYKGTTRIKINEIDVPIF